MVNRSDPRRVVLLTGVYGSGKSTVASELDKIRAAVPTPMAVVRLIVPLDEIERRLRSDVTTGRQNDLRVAADWLQQSVGVGIEDLTVANDRPIREVASDILERIGWR